MTGYRTCLDCPAPVKFGDRLRCHVCHRRVSRAALKRECPECGQVRHLTGSGACASCARAAVPGKPPGTITCARCGEERRHASHGLCNRCSLADPDRPFRYAAAMARRLDQVPPWWDDLAAFASARHHPGGATEILREAGRMLAADPAASPPQLLDRCEPASGTAGRALRRFFTSRGLALPGDDDQRRAAQRRRRCLDAVPADLSAAVAAFNDSQLEDRGRARRTGRRPLSDKTLETRLRTLRDLAAHLTGARPVTSWSQVITADLEGFLGGSSGNRHQRTYILRGFFGWAKRRKLILIDPAASLRLGSQPAFTGNLMDISAQRALFRRWASHAAHPHERLAGLLALLHGASSSQIRSLTISDTDPPRRTLNLSGRPFPTPLDPVSWAALEDCLRHREVLRTLNPHVIVTRATRTSDSPAHQSYLTRALRPAGTTPSLCRQTRISQLVTDLDPKLAATALGMQGTGLIRYLADNIDRDRLDRTPAARPQPTRALQVPPCTP
ncbi:MAG: integrase [Actinomycetota bacterium]|nr:integrase [Actinomycetota bacterium]